MNNLKPGIKSTEFYTTIAVLVVSLLVVFGLVDPADEQDLTGTVAELLGAIAAVLSTAHVVARYIQGRTALKLEALNRERQATGNEDA